MLSSLSRPQKILLGILGGLAGLIVCGLIYLNSALFTSHVGGFLSDKSGRKILLEGGLDIDWSWRPHIIFTNPAISNVDWSSEPVMFEARRVELELDILSLLKGDLELPYLSLEQPKLLLEKNAEGKANWQFGQNPAAAAVKAAAPEDRDEFPLIGRLLIREGTITYRETARGINSTIDVSTLSGESEGEEHLRLIGKGDFQEHPFSLEAMGASILQLRDSGKPYPFKLHTKIGDTEIKAEGSAIDPVKLEGLNIQFNLKGKNAADLFPIFGIALLPSPPYELGGHLTYLNGGDNAEWHFSDFSGKMGNSDISGDVSWQPSKKPPYFTGQFISNNLALADLAPFIGIKPQEAKKDARALPDTSLDISRLIAMNADVTFRGTHVKTPEVLDDFLMVASLQNGALTLNPLKFGQGQGTIQAIAKIEGLADPPKATVDASFERLSLERFFGPLAKTYGEKNVSIGLLGGRAKLVGYGKSLRDVLGTSDGAIGIGMEGGQLSRLLLEIIGLDLYKTAGLIIKGDEPAKIRCVVANFEAEKGILHTREFLIDTSVTVIRGKGTVNLKSEKLDMRLEVYPKDASLLSVRSPILITGSLKKPSVMPDPAALAARGGIVAALGALLTPIGAMLGFIEPSLGKDSNCAAFLQELQQETGAKVPKEKK